MTAMQPGSRQSAPSQFRVRRASRRPSGLSAATALLVGTVALSGCGGGDGGEASAGTESARGGSGQVGKVTNVEVLVMERTRFASTIQITGAVEAVHDAVVSAEEGGVLERFLVEKGDHVEAGQPLAQIDDRLLGTQVREAEAMAALARETFERRHRLWTEDKVGSELTYLQARHEADRLDAALDGLRTRLARTTIKAPFAGIFDDQYLDVGEMAAPGTPIARVISTDRLKVTGGVPERFATDVTTDTGARVSFDVLPGMTLECPVLFVASAIDEASRTFTLELAIDDPQGVVKPAMIANIELLRNELEDALVVPQSAVSRTEDGFRVFVAEEREDGVQATRRQVRLGDSRANQVVVERGLEPGDRVIVLGKVDDSDWVRIVDTPGESGGDVGHDADTTAPTVTGDGS